MRTIELLAPAKNLECGKAAIIHGADAVYIGADRFGARQAAGNGVEDIAELCYFAHRFGAKVHVTLNTIIYNDELPDTIALVKELIAAGADAFLVQDMGLFSEIKKLLPAHVALHASTQCDTRTVNKAKWLQAQGFDRVVLARELSADEIGDIHRQLPGLELEAFVHGALCVSYSGICYASQYCFDRSANRGACSQFCRLAFDLKDSDGKVIEAQSHLLSLKDMNQIDNLETLMRSGACAFKIEGRLKDINYVKNVVSAYSQRLDKIIAKYPSEFKRASLGHVSYHFTPDLNKTFNRGYTDYFIKGRQPNIFSPNTPKALGEFVGRVKKIRPDSFNVAGTAIFSNGDGLCFMKTVEENGAKATVLEGFRVNRAVENRLYPFKMPTGLKPGVTLYRNQDQQFEKELSGNTAERKIPVSFHLQTNPSGFQLSATLVGAEEEYGRVSVALEYEHQHAKRPQRDNMIGQLSRLGNTNYSAENIDIDSEAEPLFIANSTLSELRRMIVEALDKAIVSHQDRYVRNRLAQHTFSISEVNPVQYQQFAYLYNISNEAAKNFYLGQGLNNVQVAMECDTRINRKEKDALLMQCRHCIGYSLGYCVKRGGKKPTWHEPLFLELPDKRRFRLEFDCADCQMNIHPA